MSDYIEKAFTGAKPYAGAIIAGISYISMKNETDTYEWVAI